MADLGFHRQSGPPVVRLSIVLRLATGQRSYSGNRRKISLQPWPGRSQYVTGQGSSLACSARSKNRTVQERRRLKKESLPSSQLREPKDFERLEFPVE